MKTCVGRAAADARLKASERISPVKNVSRVSSAFLFRRRCYGAEVAFKASSQRALNIGVCRRTQSRRSTSLGSAESRVLVATPPQTCIRTFSYFINASKGIRKL